MSFGKYNRNNLITGWLSFLCILAALLKWGRRTIRNQKPIAVLQTLLPQQKTK